MVTIEHPSIDDLLAYEAGELSRDQTINMFQKLINSGIAWKLQGSYGRTAKTLIDMGWCTDV